MTREEREKAIDLLDNLRGMIEDNQGNDYDFAMKKGIEALAQEPCEDAVSRKFMQKLGATCIATRDKNGKLIALGAIENLPSVTPARKEVEE